jgi:ssDNA-binding Zn-finger/Zn-ribbon topoisomerase 1
MLAGVRCVKARYSKCRLHTLPCPECSGVCELVDGPHGMRYQCRNYPQCDTYGDAHADGSPMAIPAKRKVRKARSLAHSYFDRLWQFEGVLPGRAAYTRTKAYAWLAKELGVSVDECHIGHFDADVCKVVAKLCERKINELRKRVAA